MKVNELITDTKVSYYGRAIYNKSLFSITLYDWITKYAVKYKNIIIKIREVNQFDEKSAKKMKLDNLPCISVTGFFPDYRHTNESTYLNPIMCIDIDKDGNNWIKDWEKVKRDVMSLPYVFYSSLSCRGEGVFCYVYWDVKKDFLKIWYALEKEFKEKFNIIIDRNCKDITRLRFISYDSNTLIKKDVEMFSDEYDKIETIAEMSADIIDDKNFKADDGFTYMAIHHLISNCNYRANTYSDWLQDGFRLATFGEYGKILFMYLSQVSDNYDELIALKKFEECKRTTKKSKGCLAYYFAKLKEYYGKDWKTKIEEQ